MLMRCGLAILVLCTLLVREPADAATTVVFDFESIAIPGGGNQLDYLGPQVFVQDGLSMTVTHENNLRYALNRRTQPAFVAEFGNQAISAFTGPEGDTRFDPGAFFLDFSAPLDSVMVSMGDFGVEADNLSLQAYSGPAGTGTLIDSGTGFIPALTNWASDTVIVSGTGIRSVRMIGGSNDVPNSVFYDNITVTLTSIPEPGASVLAIGCVAGVWMRRHRRSR